MNEEIEEFDFTPLNGVTAPVASSEIVYYNSKREIVSKEEGSFTKITEFDADGNVIREVWGSYKQPITEEEKAKTR